MELPGQHGNRTDGSELEWRTVTIDGEGSRYLVGGTGPSVVLLHGFGLSTAAARWWR
ncbi:hypothetical protein ACWELJ_27225 [Nocardia sp. NPDC004582]